jgi:hypothetical protein
MWVHPLNLLQGTMSDDSSIEAALQLNLVVFHNWQPRLLLGFPFVINDGLWPSALLLVGKATLVVSKRVCV